MYDGMLVNKTERLMRWKLKGALAFQHQYNGRRVAAQAVGRAAKQLPHVTDAAICRGLKKERAV